jgi:hypothetical protein
MPHEVFISYSAEDKVVADQMCAVLEAQEIHCWIAPRDILPGMDWGSAIIDAIAGCRVMVLVVSSHSNTSSQVKREVERAINKDVIVIPFRIEDISLSKSLEYHLSVTHWMDAFTPPMEAHLETLAAKIRQIISHPAPQSLPDQPRVPPVSKPATRSIRPLLLVAGGFALCLIILIVVVGWFIFNPSKSRLEGTQATTTEKPQVSPTQAPSTPTPKAQDKEPKDKEPEAESPRIPVITGTAYDVARKQLIRAGWQPHQRHISYGRDPAVRGGNGPTFWKRGYHELVSCAGSGAAECLFEFIDPKERILQVVTQGEEADDGKYHALVKRVVFKK